MGRRNDRNRALANSKYSLSRDSASPRPRNRNRSGPDRRTRPGVRALIRVEHFVRSVGRLWLRIGGYERHAATACGGLAYLDLHLRDDWLQHVRPEAIGPEVVKHAAQRKRRLFAVDKPVAATALLVGGAVHLFDHAEILVDGPTVRYLLGTGDVFQIALSPRRTGESGGHRRGGKHDDRNPGPGHVVPFVPCGLIVDALMIAHRTDRTRIERFE